MSGLNLVLLIGNLGAEPEMKFLPSGTPMTTFRIAVTQNRVDSDGEKKENTEWFNIVTWKGLAESCNQYLAKGKKVFIEGRLQTRSWDSDGQKKYKTEVVATKVEFLDRPVVEKVEDEISDLPF